MKRTAQAAGGPAVFLAILTVLASTGTRAALDPASFNGTWKLDEAASTNPSGPGGLEQGPPRLSKGAAPGSQAGGGTLQPMERARFYKMLQGLEIAPKTLVLAVTDKDVTITADGGKPFAYKTDGKVETMPTGNAQLGDLEIKTHWDGAALKREVKTIDGLTVIESYTVSADGKQLTVAVDLKSQVEHLPDSQRKPIKRLYNRGS